MISVYVLVRTKDKAKSMGVWMGGDNTAPEECLTMETRKGAVETHYWIENPDKEPKTGKKCLCGKEEYSGKD